MKFESHTAWIKHLNQTLPKPEDAANRPLVLDLFAGCGGLALGFEAAGFRTLGVEMDADACATYRQNLSGDCIQDKLVVGYDYGVSPDVIIGGPPCQPFSVIGHQKGPRDSRDGFPAFLDAVERLQPKVAVIENVRGLLYRNRAYLDSVVDDLESVGYQVSVRLLNSKDYGVAQNRERVVIVASKSAWHWPNPLTSTPVSAGIALGPLAEEAPADGRYLTPSQDRYIAAYEEKSKCARPRDLHLDRPARTVTCRNLGGATSDMQRIKLPDGRRRMLSIREGARLQSFPDWFGFQGAEASVTKQIGNAVPPLMGFALGAAVMRHLGGSGVGYIDTSWERQMELAV